MRTGKSEFCNATICFRTTSNQDAGVSRGRGRGRGRGQGRGRGREEQTYVFFIIPNNL